MPVHNADIAAVFDEIADLLDRNRGDFGAFYSAVRSLAAERR